MRQCCLLVPVLLSQWCSTDVLSGAGELFMNVNETWRGCGGAASTVQVQKSKMIIGTSEIVIRILGTGSNSNNSSRKKEGEGTGK